MEDLRKQLADAKSAQEAATKVVVEAQAAMVKELTARVEAVKPHIDEFGKAIIQVVGANKRHLDELAKVYGETAHITIDFPLGSQNVLITYPKMVGASKTSSASAVGARTKYQWASVDTSVDRTRIPAGRKYDGWLGITLGAAFDKVATVEQASEYKGLTNGNEQYAFKIAVVEQGVANGKLVPTS